MSSMAGCWSQRLACSNLPVTVADGRWIPDLSTLQCFAQVQLISLPCDWFEWCAKSKVYLSTATAIVWEISWSLSPMLFAKATAPGLKLRFKWIFWKMMRELQRMINWVMKKTKTIPFGGWRVPCSLSVGAHFCQGSRHVLRVVGQFPQVVTIPGQRPFRNLPGLLQNLTQSSRSDL